MPVGVPFDGRRSYHTPPRVGEARRGRRARGRRRRADGVAIVRVAERRASPPSDAVPSEVAVPGRRRRRAPARRRPRASVCASAETSAAESVRSRARRSSTRGALLARARRRAARGRGRASRSARARASARARRGHAVRARGRAPASSARQRVEAHALAARAHGRQEQRRRVGDEQQHRRAPGGSSSVFRSAFWPCSFSASRVVDDRDLAPRHERAERRASGSARATCSMRMSRRSSSRDDDAHVGMRAGGDARALRAGAAGVVGDRRRRTGARAVNASASGALADAGGPDEQVGARRTVRRATARRRRADRRARDRRRRRSRHERPAERAQRLGADRARRPMSPTGAVVSMTR